MIQWRQRTIPWRSIRNGYAGRFRSVPVRGGSGWRLHLCLHSGRWLRTRKAVRHRRLLERLRRLCRAARSGREARQLDRAVEHAAQDLCARSMLRSCATPMTHASEDGVAFAREQSGGFCINSALVGARIGSGVGLTTHLNGGEDEQACIERHFHIARYRRVCAAAAAAALHYRAPAMSLSAPQSGSDARAFRCGRCEPGRKNFAKFFVKNIASSRVAIVRPDGRWSMVTGRAVDGAGFDAVALHGVLFCRLPTWC
jgi:hypothetical protein